MERQSTRQEMGEEKQSRRTDRHRQPPWTSELRPAKTSPDRNVIARHDGFPGSATAFGIGKWHVIVYIFPPNPTLQKPSPPSDVYIACSTYAVNTFYSVIGLQEISVAA
ncbi:hypothetical protein N7492_008245 [Penicillium capsulatum]|uniref:Uncharacterized protein n=1 Tax=Penicillium capsulatum TaxID=69766 RepID=A0A9W9LGW5_9EURO|nr:hypothetical protein N7492_008245 [Penicillium capsulatum]